jgi:hypothetical protein
VKKTGESMTDLRDRMSKGKVSFEEVRGAFVAATSEGGRFYRMNEKQSQTLIGKWSTLKDEIDNALLEIGESIAANLDLNELISQVSKMAEGFKKDFVPAIEEFVKAAPDMVSALGQIGAGIATITKHAAKGATNLQKWAFITTTIVSGMDPKDAAQAYIDEFMPHLRNKDKMTIRGGVEIEPAQGDLHERLRKAFPKSLEKIKAKADEPMLQAERDAFRAMSGMIDNAITKAREFNKSLKGHSPEADKMIERLQMEADTFGKSAKAIALYEAEKHKASEAQKAIIAGLHDEISAKESATKATEEAREAEERFRDSFKSGGVEGVGRGLDALARLEEARNLRAGGAKSAVTSPTMVATSKGLTAAQTATAEKNTMDKMLVELQAMHADTTEIARKDSLVIKPANFGN